MKRKLALRWSNIEVYVAPKKSASYDLDIAISSLFSAFVSLLKNTKRKQKKSHAIKFQIRMQAFLEKFSFENNKEINIDVWFPSNTYSILDLSSVRKRIKMALRDIFQCYDSFVERGSGWVLKKVLQFSINIMKYKLFQGGCLSMLLPPSL